MAPPNTCLLPVPLRAQAKLQAKARVYNDVMDKFMADGQACAYVHLRAKNARCAGKKLEIRVYEYEDEELMCQFTIKQV